MSGMWCIIASHKKQKKTSKYKFINWIYKKIYGYEEVSYMPEGVNVVHHGDTLYFRDEKTYKSVLKELKSKG
jgi:hypothetical protein